MIFIGKSAEDAEGTESGRRPMESYFRISRDSLQSLHEQQTRRR